VPLVKATYTIGDTGILSVSELQMPVNLAGERSGPGDASWKYEPECSLPKPDVDIVLIGSARAPRGRARELEVSFTFGRLQKTAVVFGNRRWFRRLGGGISTTDPEPFEQVELDYEHAFGGWDRSDPNPGRHTYEPRNPVGHGFRHSRSARVEEVALPNVEDPRHRLRSYGDTPPPAGFGFVSPDWQPRSQLAGTYDETWLSTRMPLLPTDFDSRFFNAGAAGLVSHKPVTGGEPVQVTGTTVRGMCAFRMPRIPPPVCTVLRARRRDVVTEARLDTVIVDTDSAQLLLLWRGAPIPAFPSEVRELAITIEGIPLHSV
jgi:hypothetical protein